MYLSFNWLKDFVKVPKKIGAQEIDDLLTMHTVEVESWSEQRQSLDKVVVGKVLSVEPHPNADRLRVTKVDIGGEELPIVCGAPNVAKGQKVPVALVGSQLPNGLEIKAAQIRGEESQGMICAEDELGLGSEHDGIMVLKDKAKVGQEFAKYLELDDIIFEIDNKSLSNRGDLWGHYGMARELSTLLKLPLKEYPQPSAKILEYKEKKPVISVKTEDKDACLRYIAVKIDKVKAIESPLWLKERLVAVNARPINALVDITNYVMLESGQPLHAFDADKLGDKIVVRAAKKGESTETLDGQERELPEDSLLITNGKDITAIAGIIGSQAFAVDENTTSIILEAATFDAVSVRKTSQKLSLRTDASMRFEKTLDPELPNLAWQRTWQLIKEVFPEAELVAAPTEVINYKLEPKAIVVDFSWLKKSLGLSLPRREAVRILEGLGFKIEIDKNVILATPPSWRAAKDVKAREDVLEEVARIYGYDHIKSESPLLPLYMMPENRELKLERKIQDVLSASGRMFEVYNYSFSSESLLTKLGFSSSSHLRLVNPISQQHVFLRQSLLPGMLQNLRLNQANYPHFSMFEIGRIFMPLAGDYNKKEEEKGALPYQGKRLGILVAGHDQMVFDQLKSSLSLLFSSLWPQARLEFSVPEENASWVESGTMINILVEGKELGSAGLLDKKTSQSLNLKMTSAFAEINFQTLLSLDANMPENKYQEAPKYPALTRDIAFVLSDKILYNDFWKALIDFHPLLSDVQLFDVYQGSALGDGYKSLAFHFYYRSNERTLTAEEVDAIQDELVKAMAERFEAKVRDF